MNVAQYIYNFFFKENNDKGHVEFMFHVPSVAFVVCPMGHH